MHTCAGSHLAETSTYVLAKLLRWMVLSGLVSRPPGGYCLILTQRSCPNVRSKNDKCREEGASFVSFCYLLDLVELKPSASSSLFFPSFTSVHLVNTITHYHHQPTIRLLDVAHFRLFFGLCFFLFAHVHYEKQNKNNHSSPFFRYWLDASSFLEIISLRAAVSTILYSSSHFSPIRQHSFPRHKMKYSLFTTGLCALAWSGVPRAQVITFGQYSGLP